MRRIPLLLLLASLLGSTTAACQPPSETTRGGGTLDASGHALIRAAAPAANHHWSVDVALRGAAEGTYVLLFSAAEPAEHGWFAIAPTDAALRCAAARAHGCTLGEHGDVVGSTAVGPGGSGTLRAAFDVGPGGWLRVMRVESGSAASAAFDFRLVSEALSKDEEAYRFTVEHVR